MMRSIYIRRRKDRLNQPAWVGGLVYDDFPIHSVSRTNISPNQIFTRVRSAVSSARAASIYSLRATESATSANGWASTPLVAQERKVVSAGPNAVAKDDVRVQSNVTTIIRPKTAGTMRTRSTCEQVITSGKVYVENTDRKATHNQPLNRPSSSKPRIDTSRVPAPQCEMCENESSFLRCKDTKREQEIQVKRAPALDLTNVMAGYVRNLHDLHPTGSQTERIQPVRRKLSDCRRSSLISLASRRSMSPSKSVHSTRRSMCASWGLPPEPNTSFFVFSIKIVHLNSLAVKFMQGVDRSVRVHFSLAGYVYVSKPLTIIQQASTEIADEKFTFEVNSTINSLILSVKVFEQYTDLTQNKRIRDLTAQSTELSSGLLDLTSVLEIGGEHRVSCRLSCDPETGSIPELLIDVNSSRRKTDFVLSYLEEGTGPLFKKAGYTISTNGISSFPQMYKKRGLPPGISLRSLRMTRCTYSAERNFEEVDGLKLFRAKDAKGNSYQIKRFNVMDIGLRNMLVSELNGLISCPANVAITPLDAFLDALEVVLVLDDGGAYYLRDLIEIRHKLPEQNCAIVLRQILNGLKYLHDAKIVHNDIDARNILISSSGEVRLSGFWYCTQHVGKVACKFAGPFVHMSPERLLGLDCSFASDVWSLGILAIEMITGKGPYQMSDFVGPNALFEFKQMVVSGPSPSIPRGDFSYDARLFVESCLHKNLKLRATAQALQSHFFIAKYENFGTQFLGRWVSKSKKAVAPKAAKKPEKDSLEISHQLFLQACSRAHPVTKGMPALTMELATDSPRGRNASPQPARPDSPRRSPSPRQQQPPQRRLEMQKQPGVFNAKKTIYAAFDLAFKEPRRKDKTDSDDSSEDGQ